MRFERRFVVDAPVERVRAFHEDPRAVRRLTPAPVRFLVPPPPLADGARIAFRLYVPWPVEWRGHFEEVRGDGFVDVQDEGPFASWRHEHRWRALADGRSEVRDVVTAEPRTPASRLIWAALPGAFAYRRWRTRRDVARRG